MLLVLSDSADTITLGHLTTLNHTGVNVLDRMQERIKELIESRAPMTQEEINEQRISFAYGIGNASSENITRESVTLTAQTYLASKVDSSSEK